MIAKLIRRIKLYTTPIKKGDELFGDCSDFGLTTMLEQAMHNLRDIEGKQILSYWHGDNTYKLVVELTVMPYYVFESYVLTRAMDNAGAFVWSKRTFQRRIDKKKIHSMILEGILKRSKP